MNFYSYLFINLIGKIISNKELLFGQAPIIIYSVAQRNENQNSTRFCALRFCIYLFTTMPIAKITA